MEHTLGVLVSSDKHFEYLFNLVKAASNKGKSVTVFFTGQGVLLTQNNNFKELSSYASLKVCDVSYRANNLTGDLPGVGFKDFVTQAKNAEMVAEFGRYVVL